MTRYGFWRRIRLIPFTQRFDVNPTLADDLRAEAPGILAWACVAVSTGSRGPDRAAHRAEATAAYEQDSDPLARSWRKPASSRRGRDGRGGRLRALPEAGLKQRPEQARTADEHGLRLEHWLERLERKDGARRVYRGVARK